LKGSRPQDFNMMEPKELYVYWHEILCGLDLDKPELLAQLQRVDSLSWKLALFGLTDKKNANMSEARAEASAYVSWLRESRPKCIQERLP
jgi:hypothetical protein